MTAHSLSKFIDSPKAYHEGGPQEYRASNVIGAATHTCLLEGPQVYRKGIPLSRYLDGLIRHALSAAEGKTDEDHLAGCAFNVMGWMHTLTEIEAGRLPESLNDLPFWRRDAN